MKSGDNAFLLSRKEALQDERFECLDYLMYVYLNIQGKFVFIVMVYLLNLILLYNIIGNHDKEGYWVTYLSTFHVHDIIPYEVLAVCLTRFQTNGSYSSLTFEDRCVCRLSRHLVQEN